MEAVVNYKKYDVYKDGDYYSTIDVVMWLIDSKEIPPKFIVVDGILATFNPESKYYLLDEKND